MLGSTDITDAQNRYRDYFEQSPIPSLLTDPFGVVDGANRAAVTILRVERRRLAGARLCDLIAEPDRARFARFLQDLGAPGAAARIEASIDRDDGDRIIISFEALISQRADGRSAGIRWSLLERSTSFRLAARERELWLSVLSSLPVGLFVTDHAETIEFANGAAVSILGCDPSGLAVSDLGEALSLIGQEGTMADAVSRLRSGESTTTRLRVIHPGGLAHWIEITLRTIRASGDDAHPASGHDARIVGIARRMSSEVARMTDTDPSGARMAAVLDAASDAIVCVDGALHVVLFNRAAEALFARRADSVLGKPLTALLGMGIDDDGLLVHVLAARKDPDHREFRSDSSTVSRNGHAVPVDASVSTSSIDGEIVTTAIIRDLTETRALERELLHAQKLQSLGRLAAGLAHDLNNVTAIMRSNLEFLSDELPAAGPMRAPLSRIERSTARVQTLAQSLLRFSRHGYLDWSRFDVNEVISELAVLLTDVLGVTYSIDFDLAAEHTVVRSDRAQLEQGIVNVVLNARDAMKTGGRISLATTNELEVRADGTRRLVVLTVSDAGYGIDEVGKKRMFEPFFTTKADGSGLGLATLHGVVVRSGGRIRVTSEPNLGTSVAILLPEYRKSPRP